MQSKNSNEGEKFQKTSSRFAPLASLGYPHPLNEPPLAVGIPIGHWAQAPKGGLLSQHRKHKEKAASQRLFAVFGGRGDIHFGVQKYLKSFNEHPISY